MSILPKLIDSMVARFESAKFIEIIKPFQREEIVPGINCLIYINAGHLWVGEDLHALNPGSFYFIPAGKAITMKHGLGSECVNLGKADFKNQVLRQKYLRDVSCLEDLSGMPELITVFRFEVLLYDTISFFDLLEIPPLEIPYDEELAYLMQHITLETEWNKLGRKKIIGNYMQEIIIHLCRFIESWPTLVKHLDKIQSFTDHRLVQIVKYIDGNLENDLSNKTIAANAEISENYVGQFFKSLMGKNLQDYIENQRLQRALVMLQNQPDHIQEIAFKVGFKDPAYFSRRFKIRFGFNANSIRQQQDASVDLSFR